VGNPLLDFGLAASWDAVAAFEPRVKRPESLVDPGESLIPIQADIYVDGENNRGHREKMVFLT